jgi:hypothetical protein
MKRASVKKSTSKHSTAPSKRTQKRQLPQAFKSKSPGDAIFELAYLKTHVRTLAFESKPSITGRVIYRRLCTLLNTNYINPDAPPTEYIKSNGSSGSQAVRAFTQTLNNSDEFKPDGLDLSPGDFANVTNMGELGGVIVDWYRNHGWNVSVG